MKLVAEVVPGKPIEHEIAMIERPDEISPASVGLTIAEGQNHSGEPAEGNRHCPGSTAVALYLTVRQRTHVSPCFQYVAYCT